MTPDDKSTSMNVAENIHTPLMFPLMLNVTSTPIVLVGGGKIVAQLTVLEEHSARNIHVFAAEAKEELIQAAGARLSIRWPQAEDFDRIRPQLVFVADVDDERATEFRSHARRVGALVHVQDRIPYCDFHLPARVRRGHLQVTVSTDGTAAGLSRLIREFLEKNVFGPEWAGRVEELAAARRIWKREGLSFNALGHAIRKFVADRGWLNRRVY
jgi:precorrin-2 dehydrogenase/sirohydrochlorin ferrochelatase